MSIFLCWLYWVFSRHSQALIKLHVFFPILIACFGNKTTCGAPCPAEGWADIYNHDGFSVSAFTIFTIVALSAVSAHSVVDGQTFSMNTAYVPAVASPRLVVFGCFLIRHEAGEAVPENNDDWGLQSRLSIIAMHEPAPLGESQRCQE